MTTSFPILGVEDDRILGRMLRRALADHDVHMVTHVAAARELASQKRFGAWILDIHLPDGTGLELLRWARERGDTTPALVMTGVLETDFANRAQLLGAEFIYKPVTKANLDAFLARVAAGTATTTGALDRVASRLAELVAEASLSNRERDIVGALARGVARADLAAELGISENTVKTTTRKLLRKTGYDNLDQIVRLLLRPN
jgi:two-component system response regulator DesR